MVHTFPQDIYQQLDGYDFRILNEIAFLSKQQKRRTGSAYCCPGRAYLAEKVGCDVWTISRHTSKLERLGILIKRQRRPIRGIWQTCLYKLVKWSSWLLSGIAGNLRKLGRRGQGATSNGTPQSEATPHRVRPDARIASEKTEIITPEAKSPPTHHLVAEILERWKLRGTHFS